MVYIWFGQGDFLDGDFYKLIGEMILENFDASGTIRYCL
jgi:hypothetical protein